MNANRRRFVGSLILSGGSGLAAASPAAVDLESLRAVSEAHGLRLSDERLSVLKPVLDSRQGQLQALRDVTLSDSIAPTTGIPGDAASVTR